MRVLVCGGREYDDWGYLHETLFNIHVMQRHPITYKIVGRISTIIEGGARGADFLARAWAKYYNIPVDEYPADWRTFGRGAGHIRNSLMISEGKPDLVVAFPGGKGTANMVKQAKERGLEVIDLGNTNYQKEKVQIKEGCCGLGQETKNEIISWNTSEMGDQCDNK